MLSPLMTTDKKPTGCRICLDATFGDNSLNNATEEGKYLGEDIIFSLPKVDEFEALILKNGPGFLMWKRDLRRYFYSF